MTAYREDPFRLIRAVSWGGVGQLWIVGQMQKDNFLLPWGSQKLSIINANFTLETVDIVSASSLEKLGFPQPLSPPPIVQGGTGDDPVTAQMKGAYEAWRYTQASITAVSGGDDFPDGIREGLAVMNFNRIAALNPTLTQFEFDVSADAITDPNGQLFAGAAKALFATATPKDELTLIGNAPRILFSQSAAIGTSPSLRHFTVPKSDVTQFTIT